MSIVKTQAEFNLMKKDMLKSIDKFAIDFNEFTRKASPDNWRTIGTFNTELNTLKEKIPTFKPLELKHLDQSWIRDEVLTDKERELYDATKKYNL